MEYGGWAAGGTRFALMRWIRDQTTNQSVRALLSVFRLFILSGTRGWKTFVIDRQPALGFERCFQQIS